ncbi:replication protein-like protein A 32 kDa subunit [Boeremia exigua]|uniref:replication protein-like protein A 32 kDa subunit n=1 Tax=Boeremia exigua TaxID=749465 RepID=UPI001E8DEF81|nr:replication protein-like protein A 32 kDa subunit [Boeremia exigua]KAH6614989.1 replication protein-like protein A 32 kDa subunit [Boeremia exigua]
MSYNAYETSYTSYGAGGGAGGGGFIPGDSSQQSPGGRDKQQQDSLRAVTIKQIIDAQHDASTDSFRIDGHIASQITFVAQIRNISTQTTNTTYRLDDGTGSIEVRQWVDPDNLDLNNPMRARLVEGSYCRAWGKPKSFNDRRSVNSQIVRPVEDMNEVSYHLLEATATHLYFTRGPLGGANAGAGAANTGAGADQQGGGAGGAYGNHDLSGYNSVAKKVFAYLRETPQSNEGLHQQVIAANLGLESADVLRAGDDLLSGGLIYTTVDDHTWAVLEAD